MRTDAPYAPGWEGAGSGVTDAVIAQLPPTIAATATTDSPTAAMRLRFMVPLFPRFERGGARRQGYRFSYVVCLPALRRSMPTFMCCTASGNALSSAAARIFV